MKPKYLPVIITTLLLLIQVVYFNIAYDLFLVVLLFVAAYLTGSFFKIRLPLIERFFIQMALGLGIFGFVIWLTTFYNFNYKSIFLLLSFTVILLRYKQLVRDFQVFGKVISNLNSKNYLFFPLLLLFLVFYLIAASAPVLAPDALAYHIAVPVKILNYTNYDYNVIEQVGFGNYALLPNMFFLFLMALGGTKALAIFTVFISLFILFILIRLASRLHKSNALTNGILLVYLSTPLFYQLSTALYVDLIGIFFIFSVIPLLAGLNQHKILKNALIISLTLGFAFFAKQTSGYFILPLGLFLFFYFIKGLLNKKLSFAKFLLFSVCSLILVLLPSLPAMLIIWYKTGNPIFPFMNSFFNSPYFNKDPVADPFGANHYGMNLNSIINMVYNTQRNVELDNGALGYYLLIFYAVPFILILKRQKEFIFLLCLVVVTYFLSTIFNYNLRYYSGTLILALLLCNYAAAYIISFIKLKRLNEYLVYIIVIFFVGYNLLYIFDPVTDFMFKDEMLVPNPHLTGNSNRDILEGINKKDVFLLANNDYLRGDFVGKYYNLIWFNQYILAKVESREISPVEFLDAFDYYLVRKEIPQNLKAYFSMDSKAIESKLTLFKETDYHLLYKINHNDTASNHPIIDESYDPPIEVTPTKNKPFKISPNYKSLRIEIEAEKKNPTDNSLGRYQINWLDDKGNSVYIYLVPFSLEKQRKVYTSPKIDYIPKNAAVGYIYLASHFDDRPILINSFKVFGESKRNKANFLKKELSDYGKKWPYLAE